MHPRRLLLSVLPLLAGWGWARPAPGATLPAHAPMSVLVIADAVNPNQLPPEQLTEPGDFESALTAPDSGLELESVTMVDSQCADDALSQLEGGSRPDVVLYFAHRAAKLCAGGDAQTRLVAAFEAGLGAGLGIVVFHHGMYGDIYTLGAKDSLLALVGAEASGLNWNTTMGQRVFLLDREHFVSTNGLQPTGNATLGAFDGVASGEYPFFDNIPDERYPTLELLVATGETRSPLFATDSGGQRLLGYALQRAGWTGRVVAYQPGEYQPNALDDRGGNNFQILANALYFVVNGEPQPSVTEDTNSAATGSNDNVPDAPASSIHPLGESGSNGAVSTVDRSSVDSAPSQGPDLPTVSGVELPTGPSTSGTNRPISNSPGPIGSSASSAAIDPTTSDSSSTKSLGSSTAKPSTCSLVANGDHSFGLLLTAMTAGFCGRRVARRRRDVTN